MADGMLEARSVTPGESASNVSVKAPNRQLTASPAMAPPVFPSFPAPVSEELMRTATDSYFKAYDRYCDVLSSGGSGSELGASSLTSPAGTAVSKRSRRSRRGRKSRSPASPSGSVRQSQFSYLKLAAAGKRSAMQALLGQEVTADELLNVSADHFVTDIPRFDVALATAGGGVLAGGADDDIWQCMRDYVSQNQLATTPGTLGAALCGTTDFPHGYCYLHAIVGVARLQAKAKLGPDPSLGLLLQSPSEWFIDDRLMSVLPVVRVGDRRYHVGKGGGVLRDLLCDYVRVASVSDVGVSRREELPTTLAARVCSGNDAVVDETAFGVTVGRVGGGVPASGSTAATFRVSQPPPEFLPWLARGAVRFEISGVGMPPSYLRLLQPDVRRAVQRDHPDGLVVDQLMQLPQGYFLSVPEFAARGIGLVDQRNAVVLPAGGGEHSILQYFQHYLTAHDGRYEEGSFGRMLRDGMTPLIRDDEFGLFPDHLILM